jgi:hypothetical protein
VRLIVAGVIVLILAAFGLYAWLNPVDEGSPGTRFSVLTADFGLRRDTLTRSFTLYLCSNQYASSGPRECEIDPTVTDSSTLSGSARPARPEIISTTIGGELREVDADEPIVQGADSSRCNVSRRGKQFPSNQLEVVAENRGAADLVLSMVADAGTPEEVHAGTYCGIVNVSRASGNDIPLYVLASVGSRGQGPLRIRVFGALLLGALTGAAVKWLGDRYAPVAGLRRRQRRLVRRFGSWRRQLPERAQYDLAVIDDGIGSFDPEGVDPALTELEQQGDALTRFSSAMYELEKFIEAQEQFTDLDFDPPLRKVLAAEYASVAHLRGEKFPWADPDHVAGSADELRMIARTIVAALRAQDESAYADAAQRIVGAADDTQVERLLTAPEGRPAPTVRPVMAPLSTPRPERRSFAQMMLDNSLLITMIVGAVVVAFVGYQAEFIGDESWDGGSGDYLRLFAWAFALQVAGVTILEVAGKLVTAASAPPAAPTSPAPR